jgi:DNA-binding beta-propeller fold protein YncE
MKVTYLWSLALILLSSAAVLGLQQTSNKPVGDMPVYVGRSPNEAFFTVDGLELWVTLRGENYISALDPTLM